MTTAAPSLLASRAEASVEEAAPSRSRRPLVIGLAVAAVLAGAGGWYAATRGHESTDDAQIDAEVVAVPARTAGTVLRLDFVENQAVKAGDLLAELDDEGPRARLAEATPRSSPRRPPPTPPRPTRRSSPPTRWATRPSPTRPSSPPPPAPPRR